MARQVHTPVAAPGSYDTPITPAGLAATGLSGSSGEQVNLSGNDLVIAYNTGASAYTVTVTSVADAYGRTGDVSAVSLAAGDFMIFGPVKSAGWEQSDGNLYFEASNVAVKFLVVQLP